HRQTRFFPHSDGTQSSPFPSSPPFMSGICSSAFQPTLPRQPSVYPIERLCPARYPYGVTREFLQGTRHRGLRPSVRPLGRQVGGNFNETF
ncbi:hypothetical protein, partial [Treponema endosymbiont of Eucomonympha sp.]|uniref:hypothetical protein n=1 Tax=Treponema endosymbiont of Eucomonympha sp. TaxID=1580831 RepID=UPI00164FDF14